MHKRDLEKMLAEREALLTAECSAALEFAQIAADDIVLDVATGSGRMLLELVKRGYAVVSGDVDPGALDRARDRLGDLAGRPTLLVMDAHAIQFGTSSFRAATFANAIHEIDNPRSAVDEIVRVLADDGRLLVVEFSAQGFELMEAHHQAQDKGEQRRGEMSTEEIAGYLRSSFSQVETKEFSITHAWIASGKRSKAQ